MCVERKSVSNYPFWETLQSLTTEQDTWNEMNEIKCTTSHCSHIQIYTNILSGVHLYCTVMTNQVNWSSPRDIDMSPCFVFTCSWEKYCWHVIELSVIRIDSVGHEYSIPPQYWIVNLGWSEIRDQKGVSILTSCDILGSTHSRCL